MYEYMKNHEKFMMEALNSKNADLSGLKEYHKTQIEFMQHERLIHLMVTIFFAALLMAFFSISLFYPNAYLYLLDLIIAVLMIFYIVHYYRLENGVQRWYKIYSDIERGKYGY